MVYYARAMNFLWTAVSANTRWRADTWNARQKGRSGPLVSDWPPARLTRHESEKGRYGESIAILGRDATRR